MGRKFKLSTGEVADIEDDELDEFMNDVKSSGRTVSLFKEPAPAKADAVVELAKPTVTTTVVKAEPFVEPDPTLSTETDRKLADTAPSSAPESQQPRPWFSALADAFRGTEELHGENENLDAQAKSGLGAGMIYGASSHWLDPGKDERLKATPAQRVAGEVVGSALSPLNFGAKIPAQIASSALQGGVERVADDWDRDMSPAARAISALKGAGISGTASGLFGGAAKTVQAGFGKLAPVADKAADRLRLSTWLPYDQVRGLARDKGDDAVAAYARELEAPRTALDGDSISGGYFTTAEGGERRAQKVAQEAGGRINAIEDELTSRYPVASLKDKAAGPDVDVSDMIDELRGASRGVAGRVMPAASQHARYLDKTANRLEQSTVEPIASAADGANVWGGTGFQSPNAYASNVGMAGEYAALEAASSNLSRPGVRYSVGI